MTIDNYKLGHFPKPKKGIFGHLRARVSRKQRLEHNLQLIVRVSEICDHDRFKRPSYKYVIKVINAEGWKTSDNRNYTERSLYRTLQRMGFSGIDGLKTYSPQSNGKETFSKFHSIKGLKGGVSLEQA